MSKKNFSITSLLLLSFGMAVVEVMLNSQGEVVSDETQSLWGFIFLVITIIWVIADSETNDFKKPFDFGFLIYLFWPVALPYYLITTRGFEGFVFFLGLMSIWLGPWLAGLVAYTYVYTP